MRIVVVPKWLRPPFVWIAARLGCHGLLAWTPFWCSFFFVDHPVYLDAVLTMAQWDRLVEHEGFHVTQQVMRQPKRGPYQWRRCVGVVRYGRDYLIGWWKVGRNYRDNPMEKQASLASGESE